MGNHSEELQDTSLSNGKCFCCKCGCGEKLEPHGPDDRDDTHRGLQYEAEYVAQGTEAMRREEFLRYSGGYNRILLEHGRTCSIGQESLTFGQTVRESITPKSGEIDYSCLNHLMG